MRLLKAAEVHEGDVEEVISPEVDESPKVQPLGARILAGLGMIEGH